MIIYRCINEKCSRYGQRTEQTCHGTFRPSFRYMTCFWRAQKDYS